MKAKSIHKFLSLALIAAMTFTLMPSQTMVALAAAEPSISLGSATLADEKYYYSDATVSGDGIKTILLSFSGDVSEGDLITLPEATGFTPSSTSNDYEKRVNISGDATAGDVQTYLRQVGFTMGGLSQSVTVTVTTEDIQTDTFYNKDTRHYYQYIPAGSSGITWTAAYSAAKDMTCMGRAGYLATVMSESEDTCLYSLSGGKTGWLGGTVLTNSGSRVDAEGAAAESGLYYSSFTKTSVVTGASKGWYWACGPEIGQVFYDVNSLYDEGEDGWPSAETAASADTRNNASYYNWVRIGSYAPNNQATYVSPTENEYETCLVTLPSTDTGFAWNDIREDSVDQSSAYSSKGYFVEYGDSEVGDSGSGGTAIASANGSLNNTSGPTLTAISPVSGATTGGTSVTITGRNFTGATAVTFGDTAAASFMVNSSTRITATAPAGTGTVDVTVTTPFGGSAAVTAGRYTYSSRAPLNANLAAGDTVDFAGRKWVLLDPDTGYLIYSGLWGLWTSDSNLYDYDDYAPTFDSNIVAGDISTSRFNPDDTSNLAYFLNYKTDGVYDSFSSENQALIQTHTWFVTNASYNPAMTGGDICYEVNCKIGLLSYNDYIQGWPSVYQNLLPYSDYHKYKDVIPPADYFPNDRYWSITIDSGLSNAEIVINPSGMGPYDTGGMGWPNSYNVGSFCFLRPTMYLSPDQTISFPTVVPLHSGMTSVSGTAEPGSSVTLGIEGEETPLATATTDGEGNWTATVSPLAANEVVTVDAYIAGTVSKVISATVSAAQPDIETQPQSMEVPAGDTATFSVSAAVSDSGTLSYQWQISEDNGTTWNDIVGATDEEYTTGNITNSDSGARYRCVVTNTLAGTTSTTVTDEATLTVTVSGQPVINATIFPAIGNFDRNPANQADVQITVTWGSATGVTDVKAGGSSIGASNYSVSGNTLAIKKEFLAAQATGSLPLTVEFNAGSAATLTIAVTDTTPPTINPASRSYDLSNPVDVTAAITWNSAASVTNLVYSVSPDTTLYTLDTGDYIVSDNTLTIKNSFISSLSLATGTALEFNITFDTGADSTLTVHVVDGYTPSNDADLSSLSVNGTAVTGFDPNDTEYDVELSYGASSATVSATASDSNAQVSIIQSSSLPGSATVTVTAEDGSTTRVYTVNLTIAELVTTYIVTFNSNGAVYATKTVNAGQSIGNAAWPTDPTRSSYTFGGWFMGENGTGTQFTSATPVNAAETVFAKWTYSGGGGSSTGGGSTTPTTSTYNAEVRAGNSSSSTLPVTVDKSGGTASVDLGLGNSLMSEGKTTVITVPAVPDVDTYTLGIPVPNLSTQDEQGALAFSTDTGTVTVPSNMLTGVAGINGSKAEISIGQGEKSNLPKDIKNAIGDRPLVQLTLSIDGKQTDWSNSNAPVTLSIPYKPTAEELAHPESIVIWYIDGSGNIVSIPNGHYNSATGTVTFDTTHFSDYAVAYNKVSFTDVSDTAWYGNAVGFISARGITTGTGNGYYSPDAKLTRGEFMVMIMRACGIAPDESPTDNFSDAGSTYYTGYLATAKRLGISAGVGNNLFAPSKEITRQEMFTLLYNALKALDQLPQGGFDKALSDFTDATSVADWAEEAMTLLVETGTISGNGGKLNPTGTTTRAEMAQVLYNLLAK